MDGFSGERSSVFGKICHRHACELKMASERVSLSLSLICLSDSRDVSVDLSDEF